MINNNKHLPLFGVGPVIVYGQVLLTAIAIWLTHVYDLAFVDFELTGVFFSGKSTGHIL